MSRKREGGSRRQGLLGTRQGTGARREVRQVCCPGTSGEGAGCTLSCTGTAVRGGKAELGQKWGSELAGPGLRGWVSGEFARVGGAGLVLTFPQVPSQYLAWCTGGTGRGCLIQPKTCPYELNLQK